MGVEMIEGERRTSSTIGKNRTINRYMSLQHTCKSAFLFRGGCTKVLVSKSLIIVGMVWCTIMDKRMSELDVGRTQVLVTSVVPSKYCAVRRSDIQYLINTNTYTNMLEARCVPPESHRYICSFFTTAESFGSGL